MLTIGHDVTSLRHIMTNSHRWDKCSVMAISREGVPPFGWDDCSSPQLINGIIGNLKAI